MNPQSLSQTAATLGTLDLGQLEQLAIAVLVAFLLSQPLQAIIEAFIAHILPAPFFFIKPFIPSAVASLLGGLANHFGLSPEDSAVGAATLAKMLHWTNNQPWALDLEGKVSKFWASWLQGGGGGKAAGFLFLIGISLAVAAPKAHASMALSNNAGLGSSVYTIQNDGSWLPTGGTLLSDNLNLEFGQMDAGAFSEYVGISLGAGFESRNGEQFGDLLLGLTLPVPATSGDIFIGPSWRMFTGDNFPGVAVAANFQIGQPLKTWP